MGTDFSGQIASKLVDSMEILIVILAVVALFIFGCIKSETFRWIAKSVFLTAVLLLSILFFIGFAGSFGNYVHSLL